MKVDIFGSLTISILCVDYRILYGDLRWMDPSSWPEDQPDMSDLYSDGLWHVHY